MKNIICLMLVPAAFAIISGISPGTAEAETTTNRVITATGQGSILVPETIATIRVAINEKAKTPQKAQEQVRIKANRLLGALKQTDNLGIQTATVSMTPNWNYQNNRSQIDGYTGTYAVLIKAKIENAGTIIDTAVNNGASTVNDPQLSISDSDRNKAEQKAIENATMQAKSRADTSLSALGLKAKGVTQINVMINNSRPTPLYRMEAMKASLPTAAEAPPTQIEAGKEEVTAEVSLSETY